MPNRRLVLRSVPSAQLGIGRRIANTPKAVGTEMRHSVRLPELPQDVANNKYKWSVANETV